MSHRLVISHPVRPAWSLPAGTTAGGAPTQAQAEQIQTEDPLGGTEENALRALLTDVTHGGPRTPPMLEPVTEGEAGWFNGVEHRLVLGTNADTVATKHRTRN